MPNTPLSNSYININLVKTMNPNIYLCGLFNSKEHTHTHSFCLTLSIFASLHIPDLLTTFLPSSPLVYDHSSSMYAPAEPLSTEWGERHACTAGRAGLCTGASCAGWAAPNWTSKLQKQIAQPGAYTHSAEGTHTHAANSQLIMYTSE